MYRRRKGHNLAMCTSPHSSPPGGGAAGAACCDAPTIAASIFLVPETMSSMRNNKMAVWKQSKVSSSSAVKAGFFK